MRLVYHNIDFICGGRFKDHRFSIQHLECTFQQLGTLCNSAIEGDTMSIGDPLEVALLCAAQAA